ncbi:glycoside hydrolase family 13 protein [Salinibacterium sp.]|uniref:glycoside hydrolase family 13 protein n=1 Tax=Salinibacterium sp. TaxID=1915057 RepID=UPI00286C0F52|nr:glycoside hydrolase family 13 protein [Salinibacterium sp.]
MTLESAPDFTVPADRPVTGEQVTSPGSEWWRTAVIYQIYPRSFADSTGDGIGDLPGITSRLHSLAELGVDAVWLSPFFSSPQKDAGYDVSDYCDVDPMFGTLADFDTLMATAHDLGLRVIADMVPNHTSDQHRWFQEALASSEGSAERDRYMFRDGKGPNGDIAPNNWESVFGGPMWQRITNPDGTPGQWYLHIFDVSQPDLNWENPWVREQFFDILRFWLDRGVDGFRVDVAHGMIKEEGLPDYTPPMETASMGGTAAAATDLVPGIADVPPDPPYWGHSGVHDIWRGWNAVLAEYPGDRVMAAEAWVDPLEKMALWVRPDEFSQAFNFGYMFTEWTARDMRKVVDDSIAAFGAVGAPSTWVLSNHDVVRHATRLALHADVPQGSGIGPKTPGKPDTASGLRRARAATSLMLSLPGSAYLYQGEELGLPEDMELPDSARQDPTWLRTNHEKYGRDGCRVPVPWEADKPSYGFGPSGNSWLPQPEDWAPYARDAQEGVAGSTLELYRTALALRSEHRLGAGAVQWLDGYGPDVIALRNGPVTVIVNLGKVAVELPIGELLLASEDIIGGALPADTAVWLRS